MASRPPRKQSLLKKALHDKKILTQQVRMYQRVMDVIRDENTLEDMLRLIITSVTKGLGFDRAGIFLADRNRRVVERVMGIDRHGKFEGKGVEFPLSHKRGQHLFSDIVNGFSKGRFTNNLQELIGDKSWKSEVTPGVFCNAVVPILDSAKKPIGVMAADNLFSKRRIQKSDMVSLMNFASEAGLAIESCQMHRQIRELATKDSLTGVFNRRFFDNYLPQEFMRCRRYKRPLSLLYIDLDHFKRINDLYGHLAGDTVLKHVANRLLNGLRNVDMVIRMGGDEFSVILPEVGPLGSKIVAERLFLSITKSPSPIEEMRQSGETISISLGLSSYGETMNDFKDLLKLADQSLYQAKAAGRNRVGDLAGGPL